jgi:hypothetical protein
MAVRRHSLKYTKPVEVRVAFKPTEAPDRRHKQIFVSVNAAVFIFDQIRRRFADLETALIEYDDYQRERPHEVDKPLLDAGVCIDVGYAKRNDVVSAAWDVVDWADRLRKVLGATAGIKKNEPWFQLVTRALAVVEEVRHFLQHFDASLSTLVTGTYPIMGAVIASFRAPDGYYARILIASTVGHPADTEMKICGYARAVTGFRRVECIVLSVANLSINLSLVESSIIEAQAGFAELLKKRYKFVWPKS